MAENVTNELLLEHMKAIREDTADTRRRLTSLESEIRNLKSHMATFMQSEVLQDQTIAAIMEDMQRIKNRLDIVD